MQPSKRIRSSDHCTAPYCTPLGLFASYSAEFGFAIKAHAQVSVFINKVYNIRLGEESQELHRLEAEFRSEPQVAVKPASVPVGD